MVSAPLRPLPHHVEKIWAGGLLPDWLDVPQKTGEVWLVSDVEGTPSGLASGGTLRDAVEADPEAMLGKRELEAQRARGETPRFPYLVKLLDIGPPLSVQLHPDAATARALGDGERGKCEAWLVLGRSDEAAVYAGAPAGSSADELIEAAQAGNLGERLDRFVPEEGEGFPILPGTLHTAKGLLVLEAQETSDITYRVFDWGRGRELHLEQARTVLERLGAGQRPKLAGPWTLGTRSLAAGCPFRFEASELRAGATLALPATEGPIVLVGLGGGLELATEGGDHPLVRGESLVIPASVCADPGWGRVVASGGARFALIGPALEAA